jgi:hypothetical protein
MSVVTTLTWNRLLYPLDVKILAESTSFMISISKHYRRRILFLRY